MVTSFQRSERFLASSLTYYREVSTIRDIIFRMPWVWILQVQVGDFEGRMSFPQVVEQVLGLAPWQCQEKMMRLISTHS